MRAAHANERGSALMIVFVFAAILAISLYMEMPISVFEAKRQKEQLLIDRGNEYAHAVKLYVRHFHTYPTSFDQLEDTNRMRFLRHRFKDPFTGKDDWRLLHAAPNGMLTDSKVQQTQMGMNGQPGMANASANGGSAFGSNNSTFGSNTSSTSSFGGNTSSFGSNTSSFGSNTSTFGSNSGSSFGNNSGSNANGQSGVMSWNDALNGGGGSGTAADGGVIVPALPQRAPAVQANAGPPAGENSAPGSENESSPNTNVSPAAPLTAGMAVAGENPPAQNAEGQTPQNVPPPNGNEPNGQQGAPGANGQQGAGAGSSNNGMQMVRNLLSTASQPVTGSSSGNNMFGGTGGLAGVASKAHGRSIKVVNDQTDYSLWEFYYDPTKDATQNAAAAQAGNGATASANAGLSTSGTSTFSQPSGFGQSSFGQSSSGQGGFGQSSNGQSSSSSSFQGWSSQAAGGQNANNGTNNQNGTTNNTGTQQNQQTTPPQ